MMDSLVTYSILGFGGSDLMAFTVFIKKGHARNLIPIIQRKEGGRKMKKLFVLLMGLVFLAACATAPPKTGFLGEYASKMQPGPKGGAKLRWLKPGVDFSKYSKVMVDPVSFVASEGSEADAAKDIDPAKLKELGDKCTQAVVDAIKEKYPVVTEPGPDVAQVRFAIVDLKKSYPVISGVTSILPIGLAITLLKRPVTGSWTGGGSTVAQVMAKDSATNDVIAVAQDTYEAGFFERFSRYGQAEDAFKSWGEKIVKFLDESKAANK
jgi:hypothetical protein